MTRFVAGIDGGQSSTSAVIIDETGAVRGRGTAGPADHVDEEPGSRKFAQACERSIIRALEAGGLPRKTRFAAVCAGLSGFDADFDGVMPVLATQQFRVVHDAPIALAGAVTQRPAVVVIAGTGSVAYGEAEDGTAVRVGGWGYLFGDHGSAYALARDALAFAMTEEDRGVRSPLGEAALAFFDRSSLRELATHTHLGRIPRADFAKFARVVRDAARLGDRDAARIVEDSAFAAAGLAARCIDRLQAGDRTVAVALAGGAFTSDAFSALVRARLQLLAPLAIPVVPLYDAAVGAALLAFADAGMSVPERITG